MFRKEDEMNTECRQALTLVFIEDQTFENLYDAQTAFTRGTLFKDLDKPLMEGMKVWAKENF